MSGQSFTKQTEEEDFDVYVLDDNLNPCDTLLFLSQPIEFLSPAAYLLGLIAFQVRANTVEQSVLFQQ